MNVLPTPIKGKADWREYRAFRLENGVTCLVVHDKESKTTSMSCCVNTGAAADPRELSGLAHFCEHMCFLGSEKYPGENEYKRYLSAHGGRSNASTSMHLTNYKFEVLADRAEKAVDIFSNFFVAPLFTSSGTGREVQAVDSENSKNLTDDSRRRLQILKDLADPEHYYSKFSTGNSITLPTDDPEKLNWVREALLAFHKKHYTPENMTVVIAGPQSLDTLQEWIVPRYSAIGSKEFPESEDEMSAVERLVDQGAKDAPFYAHFQPEPQYHSAFNPSLQGGSWPVLLTTKPLRSMRKLVMMFPMPSDRRVPDNSPASVLSHLLGHEGPGSAFAVLQNHGMLSSLSAGPRTRAPDFNLFQIEMELTEKGETRWMEVVDLIFAYCRLVTGQAVAQNKDFDDLKRIWGEVSKLDAMFFDQTSPNGVYSYAPNLAERVVAYGTETCLSAGSMLNESEETFPRDQVLQASRLLVPTNCIIERCSQAAWDETQMKIAPSDHAGVFGKRTEKWYGVEYYLSRIDDKVIQAWEGSKGLLDHGIDWGEVSLPRPNRYIPRTLELCPELAEEAKTGPHIEKEIEPPNLLIDDDSGRLFHRLDDRYALPQSSLTFLIRNGAAQNCKTDAGDWKFDQNAAILSAIVSASFNQAMAQETYDADLAGLYWSVGLGSAGIKLSCFGFSDRLPDLALKILREFLSGDYIQASYFDTSKDRIIRGYRTFFESRRADSHAIYYRDALLASKDNGIDEALKVAEAATLQSAIDHHKRLVANDEILIDCLLTGNVSPVDAKKFYVEANKTIQETRGASSILPKTEPQFPASFFERRLPPGEDIELHFASKNPEEENGAVVFTYQSPIPAFKGEEISHLEGLKSTSAIRLLCHMLREPLFDELRTKQALGYVVSSYYELGYSSRIHPGPVTVPIDFLTINVLSRKLSPPEIANRIDEFLDSFRESLQGMPESEIQNHADALSTTLLKPIQKLQNEASTHFGKIQRYAPEIFHPHEAGQSIPWDSVKPLARTIQSLKRSDLLAAWDRMMDPRNRSRIVSCVYGKTFPLTTATIPSDVTTRRFGGLWEAVRVVDSFQNLMKLRNRLGVFDDSSCHKRGVAPRFLNPLASAFDTSLSRNRTVAMVGIGVLGFGVIGLTLAGRSKKLGARR